MSKKCIISCGKFNKIHILIPIVSILNFVSYNIKKYSLFKEDNKHPIIYINCYSLSLSFSFILLIIKKILNKKNNNIVLTNIEKRFSNLSQRQTTKTKKFLWILLVSIIDFIAIILSSIFWLDVVDSINAWSFDILTLSLSYRYILKKRLHKHHILSILIFIIIGAIINFIQIFGHEIGVYNLINCLNHALFSFTHIMYKYLMITKLIKYYEILFLEGIIELLLSIITLIITTSIGYIDNFWDFRDSLDGTKISLIIANMVLELIFNTLKFLIIDLYSPYHAFLLYLYTDLLNYIIEIAFFEGLEKYILITILNIICVVAMMIYLEKIELNFCGLSKMIKKNIEIRSEQDSISAIEDINDDEKDINFKGYSIELINDNQEQEERKNETD